MDADAGDFKSISFVDSKNPSTSEDRFDSQGVTEKEDDSSEPISSNVVVKDFEQGKQEHVPVSDEDISIDSDSFDSSGENKEDGVEDSLSSPEISAPVEEEQNSDQDFSKVDVLGNPFQTSDAAESGLVAESSDVIVQDNDSLKETVEVKEPEQQEQEPVLVSHGTAQDKGSSEENVGVEDSGQQKQESDSHSEKEDKKLVDDDNSLNKDVDLQEQSFPSTDSSIFGSEEIIGSDLKQSSLEVDDDAEDDSMEEDDQEWKNIITDAFKSFKEKQESVSEETQASTVVHSESSEKPITSTSPKRSKKKKKG